LAALNEFRQIGFHLGRLRKIKNLLIDSLISSGSKRQTNAVHYC